jgi:hypothetical protein
VLVLLHGVPELPEGMTMTTTMLPVAHCFMCSDTGFTGILRGPGASPVCTCGAGLLDELTLHAADCDAVPCPFDQLLNLESA